MNPHKRLDRETLLRLIDHSLDAVSEHSADGTLGVVVRQIMVSLADENQDANKEVVNSKPVPVYDVASYVDGSLDDRQQIDAITDAAATDPGLMMEIVSAFQSQHAGPVEPISSALRSRLIALRTSPSTGNASDDLNAASDVHPIESDSAVAHPSKSAALHDGETGAETLPQITPAVTPVTKPRVPDGSSNSIRLAGLLAIAAAIFFGIGWWVRSGIDTQSKPIAGDPENAVEEIAPTTERPGREPQADPETLGPRFAENPKSQPPPETPDPSRPIILEPKLDDSGPDAPVFDPESETRAMVAVEPESEAVIEQPETMPTPEAARNLPQPTRLVAQWDQVDGLLVRSTTSTVRPQAPTRNTTSLSQSDQSNLASVASGAETTLASGAIGERLRLQTLPLCRAAAKLDSGGELVMASDTQLEFTVTGSIDLRFGSIALMGLDADTIVRIGRNLANSVSVQGQPGGTIVVRKTLDGIEMDVRGQASQIAGRSFEDSRVSVSMRTLEPARLEDATERLPRWTRERVDRIELGRNVLGQLSSSNDVRTTMMQTLQSGAVRGDAAATLRRWLVVANSDNLLRLIGSPDPLLREAALQHLRNVDPKDPRHRPLWHALQMRGQNSRTFASVRSFFVELWSKRRPNATRREQLLRMLQAQDPAARATANFLLRGFYGPGPRFELNAPPAARARTVNAWRTVINRID